MPHAYPPLPAQEPTATAPLQTRARRAARMLAGICATVLLAHGAVLHGMNLSPVFSATPAANHSDTPVFTTRTITTPLAPEPLAEVTPPARKPPKLERTPPSTPKAPAAPVETAQNATGNIAPLPTPTLDDAILLADATPSGASATAATKASTVVPQLQNYAYPGSVRLKYEVKGEAKGFPYTVNGDLLWVQDGSTYDARLEISHFLLGSRVQTSTGQLTPKGLEPTRFGDKVRSEVAAHFERAKGKVTFSTNTPDAPLQAGAQDHLSVFFQIAAMLGGEPTRFTQGSTLAFQAVGARASESWVFVLGATEKLTLPGGEVSAIKLVREPTAEYDTRLEIWMAPSMSYLPVRIKLTQSNGDFADQLWSATKKP